MKDEEYRPLLPSSSTTPSRKRLAGIGCLLVVGFFQVLSRAREGSMWAHDSRVLSAVFASRSDLCPPCVYATLVVVYFLPIVIGTYTDTMAGPYNALFIGLCISTLGSFFGLVGVLSLTLSPYRINLFIFIVVMFFMSKVLVNVGLVFTSLTVVTFGYLQGGRKRGDVSSYISWFLWTGALGITVHSVLFSKQFGFNLLASMYKRSSFYGPIWHGATLILDSLSLSIFLFGKHAYFIPSTTEEGRKSFKDIFRTINMYFGCLRRRVENEWSFSVSTENVRLRKALARQQIRKWVFIAGLFSSNALLFIAEIVFDVLLEKGSRHGLHGSDITDMVKYAVFVITIPIIEIIRRNTGFHFWQDNVANQLKAYGCCFILEILAGLAYGILNTVYWYQHDTNVYYMYQFFLIPSSLLMGMALLVAGHNFLMFLYFQSPPGLATLVTACGISIALIGVLLDIPVRQRLERATYHVRLDVLLYAYTGVLLAVFLVIFIPMSLWYLKTEQTIEEIKEQLDDEHSDTTRGTASTRQREAHGDCH